MWVWEIAITSIATTNIHVDLIFWNVDIEQCFQLWIRLVPIERLRLLVVAIVPILLIVVHQNLSRFLFPFPLLLPAFLLWRHASHYNSSNTIMHSSQDFIRFFFMELEDWQWLFDLIWFAFDKSVFLIRYYLMQF